MEVQRNLLNVANEGFFFETFLFYWLIHVKNMLNITDLSKTEIIFLQPLLLSYMKNIVLTVTVSSIDKLCFKIILFKVRFNTI